MTIAARICRISAQYPNETSGEIAWRCGARPEYVRVVWQRNGIKKSAHRQSGSFGAVREALEQLFLAITEEDRDVEVAISFAERVLYGHGHGKETS